MALTRWATHVLQWELQWVATQQCDANLKRLPQFRLGTATRPHEVESLVIADQHAAVNTFPGLVHTARHAMEDGLTLSRP